MTVELEAAAEAWRAWDARPGDPARVIAKHVACAPLADHAGVPLHPTYLARVVNARRLGMYPREALAHAAGIDLGALAA